MISVPDSYLCGALSSSEGPTAIYRYSGHVVLIRGFDGTLLYCTVRSLQVGRERPETHAEDLLRRCHCGTVQCCTVCTANMYLVLPCTPLNVYFVAAVLYLELYFTKLLRNKRPRVCMRVWFFGILGGLVDYVYSTAESGESTKV